MCLAIALCLPAMSEAHDLSPAYLQLRQTSAESYDMLWKVALMAENLPHPSVELPSDCVDVAVPNIRFADGRLTERRTIRRKGGLTGATIHIDGLVGTMTDVIVRVEGLNGATQIARLTPGSPSFVVLGAQSSSAGTWVYLRLGFEHIMLGVDHLLFVLGLLLVVRDGWTLLKTVTAFTVAHSLTLAAATLGYASAPLPPLNAAIALSILFLGPEIVRVWRGETSLTIRRPWIVAFAFGLLHGFGFATGLSTAGMPRSAIPPALLLFNVGVELGQLTFVGLMMALVRSFTILEMRWPIWVARAPGYAVGVCGAFWTVQRTVMIFGKVGR